MTSRLLHKPSKDETTPSITEEYVEKIEGEISHLLTDLSTCIGRREFRISGDRRVSLNRVHYFLGDVSGITPEMFIEVPVHLGDSFSLKHERRGGELRTWIQYTIRSNFHQIFTFAAMLMVSACSSMIMQLLVAYIFCNTGDDAGLCGYLTDSAIPIMMGFTYVTFCFLMMNRISFVRKGMDRLNDLMAQDTSIIIFFTGLMIYLFIIICTRLERDEGIVSAVRRLFHF